MPMTNPHLPHFPQAPALPRGLRCEAIALLDSPAIPAEADRPTGWAGRWRLNTGRVMGQYLPQLKEDGYVRVIVDLATALFARPVVPANYMHFGDDVVGKWIDGQVSPSGIDASLILYLPNEADQETTKERLATASYTYDLLRRDHPFEVSIEGDNDETTIYERVTASAEVNGVTYNAFDYAEPLYIARHVTIKGAAIVDYGADSDTVRLAARRPESIHQPPSTETPPMKNAERLAALEARHPKAHHGLIARLLCQEETDEAIDTAVKIAAAEQAAEEAKTQMEALKAENEDLKNKLEAAEHDDAEEEEEEEDPNKGGAPVSAGGKPGITAGGSTTPAPTAGGGQGEGDAPKTFREAFAILAREKITGMRARGVALKRWPDLRKDVPHLAK